MGQTEVTVGQFRQFVKATGYKTQAEREGGAVRHFPNWEYKMDPNTNWLNPGFPGQTVDHPVICVSWNDAVEFCTWLSKQEGKNYRLPTDAEWEYSCRAGSKGRWSFGDNESEFLNYARIVSNSQGHTWPVAGLKENAWGLHDMHGSAWEWCQDMYDGNYYTTSPPKDPPGPGAGVERVVRGGGWGSPLQHCRSAFRSHNNPGDRTTTIGFRVVMVVSPIAPFTDADVQRIAALPAALQVDEVRKELARRNRSFDGREEHLIEDGVVTRLKFSTLQVTDLSPVRALAGLRKLEIGNYPHGKSSLDDLSPLKGLPLVSLDISGTKVSDLTPLKEMKLQWLYAMETAVSDLGALRGMPLAHLDLHMARGVTSIQMLEGMPLEYLNLTWLNVADLSVLRGMTSLRDLILTRSAVADLAPVKDLKVRSLGIQATKVSDLSPLQGMELSRIAFTPKNITKGLDIIRDMKSLKTIGIDYNQSWPAAEFWERYDKGEFK
jgi:hypothetical protein